MLRLLFIEKIDARPRSRLSRGEVEGAACLVQQGESRLDPSTTKPKQAAVGQASAIHPKATTEKSEQRGKTYIADEVVSVIARIAAEQVEGVHQLGDSSLRGVISRFGRSSGIDSEVGYKEAAIDLDVVVEYGFPITKVTNNLRSEIIASVEYMTGRKVVEVNINVVDVFVPRVEQKQTQKRQLD